MPLTAGGGKVNLTNSQRRAIEHRLENLQLIACAGSGKTEVVARRVVHLLTPGRKGSLLPKNIIAFTFTDKAAAELKERIVTRTREALGEIPGMAEMFVGTIHAFCLELLKSESPKYLKYEILALPGIEWVILGDHRAGSMQVRTLRRRYSSLRNP